MTPLLTKNQKRTLGRIIISLALLLGILTTQQTALIPTPLLLLALYLIPYLIIGHDILLRAGKNILHGKILDENFLMTIATIGAFCLGEYPEAVAVMLFYQTGELFQNYAVSKTRKSITALMDIRPDHANIEQNGTLIEIDPEELHVGDEILIKPGDRVPLDGIILSGTSELDTASLTGESLPRPVTPGDPVISGSINLSGLLRVRVSAPYTESTVARILDLVENAAAKKAKTENFITTFARYYTPAVVGIAAALAVLPPLLLGDPFPDWISRALIFLVVSCPCALVISIPLSFYGGIGGASRNGILIKGGNYLETLARTGTVVFDKTGTLTTGTFRVTEILPADGITADQLLTWAASAESSSTHPLARSLLETFGKPLDRTKITDIKETAGRGVTANVNGIPVLAGTAVHLAAAGIAVPDGTAAGTAIHLAADGRYAGCIRFADTLKPHAKNAVTALKADDNPLGATAYQTAGETINGVTTASEYYKATIEYVNPLGDTLGTIVIDAPTRDAYDDIIAEILATTAITQAYAADATATRNTAKDSWNVRLKIHDPTGEIYYLNFTRKDLKISSYEADAILTKVDTWADGVAALN